MNHAGVNCMDEHAEVLVWNTPSKPEFIPCFGIVLGMGLSDM